jgi:dGTPase
MSIRLELEGLEEKTLHPRAAMASRSRGRRVSQNPCDLRTSFQRDRDRILHSKAFRRLKHKTQVFLAPRGDHYRTRLTHTLEVSQIARTISRALHVNEDLTEAIALGHDLGHTPFGHAGEESLNQIVQGGFSHVEQSVRVVEKLEREGRGLNLTFEVLDGIRKHSKGLSPILPPALERAATIEAQIVRIADIVAYINHDIDDALRAAVLTPAELPAANIARVGTSHSGRIGFMVQDIISNTSRNGLEYATMSSKLTEDCEALRDFLYQRVYYNPETHQEFQKASKLLRDLFEKFREHPEEMGADFSRLRENGDLERRVCDFLAGPGKSCERGGGAAVEGGRGKLLTLPGGRF